VPSVIFGADWDPTTTTAAAGKHWMFCGWSSAAAADLCLWTILFDKWARECEECEVERMTKMEGRKEKKSNSHVDFFCTIVMG
jgi:hypothetical protein